MTSKRQARRLRGKNSRKTLVTLDILERILATAADVLGSRQEAKRWIERPAPAFSMHRPVELLATSEGVAKVETLLAQIEYGVYI